MTPDKARAMMLLLIVIAATLMVALVQLPGNTLLWRALQNAGHVPLFILITLCVLMLVERKAKSGAAMSWQRVLTAVAVVLVLALVTELLQTASGRQVSIDDLIHDAQAVLIALLLYAAFHLYNERPLLRTLQIIAATGLLLYTMLPLFTVAWHSQQRNQAFPVVMDLSAPWQTSFLVLQQASVQPAEPATGFDFSSDVKTRVVLSVAQYPGVENLEPVADWSDYNNLVFSIASNAQEAISLVLRIHDATHNQRYSDRFNRRLIVQPGVNHFRINLQAVQQAPAGRQMDLSRIVSIMIFAVNPETGIAFDISPLRLEK